MTKIPEAPKKPVKKESKKPELSDRDDAVLRGPGRPKTLDEQTVLDVINGLPEKSISTGELGRLLNASRTTAWRVISLLRAEGKISFDGNMGGGSATKWTTRTASSHLADPARNLTLPIEYDFDRIGSYVPNKSQLLPADIMGYLMKIGTTAQTRSAADIVARVRSKILIEMSWASSILEGNQYTLGETITLFEQGEHNDKKSASDATMLLNHRDAIAFVMDSINEIKIDTDTVRGIHGMLSSGLLTDSSLEGQFRNHPVTISGSMYRPLSDPILIERELSIMLDTAAEIQNPFEKSFFLLVNLSYLQTFSDVNKRTARITSNIPLMQAGLCPLSFFDFKKEAYEEGIVHYYEAGRTDRLAQAYLEGYDLSVSRYKDLLHHVGSSDDVMIRSEFRRVIHSAIRNFVLDSNISKIEEAIGQALATEKPGVNIDPGKMADLTHYVSRIADKLHDGQLAIYGLKKDELKAYRTREAERAENDGEDNPDTMRM